MDELICWNCGAALGDVPRPVSRRAHCPRCFTEVRCCRMCHHFDPAITTGQCAEDRAEPPLNKETANFCEWYEPHSGGATGDTETSARAHAKLDVLFGNPSAPEQAADRANAKGAQGTDSTERRSSRAPASREDEARAKLDALFGNNGRPAGTNKPD